MKIPCIKCNSELFTHIKPFLQKWGYEGVSITNWELAPVLVINLNGHVGKYSNLDFSCEDNHDRELVDDVEKFLSRAARLKGCVYKNEKFTKSDLKSGMVVEDRRGEIYLVVDGNLISRTGYLRLDSISETLECTDESCSEYDIVRVYGNVSCWGYGFNSGISHIKDSTSILLWERTEKIVTMQQIADKFGIPLKDLRIVDYE